MPRREGAPLDFAYGPHPGTVHVQNHCRQKLLGADASYAEPVPFFALTLVHGPNWDSSRDIREQAAWDEHAQFMDGLVDRGFILIGGPVDDGEETLHAVNAADE